MPRPAGPLTVVWEDTRALRWTLPSVCHSSGRYHLAWRVPYASHSVLPARHAQRPTRPCTVARRACPSGRPEAVWAPVPLGYDSRGGGAARHVRSGEPHGRCTACCAGGPQPPGATGCHRHGRAVRPVQPCRPTRFRVAVHGRRRAPLRRTQRSGLSPGRPRLGGWVYLSGARTQRTSVGRHAARRTGRAQRAGRTLQTLRALEHVGRGAASRARGASAA